MRTPKSPREGGDGRLVASYDLIEFVNESGKSVEFDCNFPKLSEDAVGGVEGLEKPFNFH